jgi:flavodoxin
MYRYYIDNETGEKVENEFINLLIGERKVKLKYGTYIDDKGKVKDCWYDFIIKQVNENSSSYLYTY